MALKADFERRIQAVQTRMGEVRMDVLIISAPENMHYLTGYDGWSFYLNQCLLLARDRPTPIWIGRGSDRNEAGASPVIAASDIHVYDDSYIQSDTLHPYDFVADRVKELGWQSRRIGVAMDNYYFSARAFAALQYALPDASLVDDGQLVNWLRVIKEPDEVAAMRMAGDIASHALLRGAAAIKPGFRKADTAAALLGSLTAPHDLAGGYSAIAPLIITGEGPARPHTTWSDERYGQEGSVILEIAGVNGRYHCPIARTVSIGEPSASKREALAAQIAVLRMIERRALPGVSCGELAGLCAATLQEHGFTKQGRFGYSTGLAYPPDWGEHTISIRQGESAPIREGMTLFFIPAIWGGEWSVALGETFHITANGAERLTSLPYDMIVLRNMA